MLLNGTSEGLSANSYVKMMPHTAAANIGIFFGLRGRIIPTSSACTSGSQAIGYAYESIKHGQQTLMLAGGAEELCPSEAIAFDMLYATSRRNDAPRTTPRPYDRDRDGLVVGEGAGVLVARRAGARARARCTHSRGSHGFRNELRRRARHAAGRGNDACRHGARAARCRAGAGGDRLRERAWHGDGARRHRRVPRHRRGVRRAHADQHAEELSRAHARRLRRARSRGSASR